MFFDSISKRPHHFMIFHVNIMVRTIILNFKSANSPEKFSYMNCSIVFGALIVTNFKNVSKMISPYKYYLGILPGPLSVVNFNTFFSEQKLSRRFSFFDLFLNCISERSIDSFLISIKN